MKRFEFRLDSVLRLRQTQLDTEKAKLQQLLAEKNKIVIAIETTAKERHQAKNWVYGLPDMGNAELRYMSAFLVGLDSRNNMLRRRLDEAERVVAQQRHRVVQAERNVKLLNKLRARKLEEWKQEADKELEEIAQDSWLSANRGRKAAAALDLQQTSSRTNSLDLYASEDLMKPAITTPEK